MRRQRRVVCVCMMTLSTATCSLKPQQQQQLQLQQQQREADTNLHADNINRLAKYLTSQRQQLKSINLLIQFIRSMQQATRNMQHAIHTRAHTHTRSALIREGEGGTRSWTRKFLVNLSCCKADKGEERERGRVERDGRVVSGCGQSVSQSMSCCDLTVCILL